MQMKKSTKKMIIGIAAGVAVMLLVAFLPPETELMTRQGWKYLGCFSFLLISLVSGALPDWAATIATMFFVLAFGVADVKTVTSQFSGTTVWLCIGVFLMSIGINASGLMKRLALLILTKFPGTYRGQITAMLLAGLVTTPFIPSSYAKTSIMAPLIGQVCEAVGVEKGSKQARGIWLANFMGTYVLGVCCNNDRLHAGLELYMAVVAEMHRSLVCCFNCTYLHLLCIHLRTEGEAFGRRKLFKGAV